MTKTPTKTRPVYFVQPRIGQQVAIVALDPDSWEGAEDTAYYWGEVLAVDEYSIVLRRQWGLAGDDEGSDLVFADDAPITIPVDYLQEVHSLETWLRSPMAHQQQVEWNGKTIEDFPWAVGPDGKAL